MPNKHYSNKQKIAAVQEAEETSVRKVSEATGISPNTIQTWKKQYSVIKKEHEEEESLSVEIIPNDEDTLEHINRDIRKESTEAKLKGIRKIAEAFDVQDLKDPKALHAIAGAVKILADSLERAENGGAPNTGNQIINHIAQVLYQPKKQ